MSITADFARSTDSCVGNKNNPSATKTKSIYACATSRGSWHARAFRAFDAGLISRVVCAHGSRLRRVVVADPLIASRPMDRRNDSDGDMNDLSHQYSLAASPDYIPSLQSGQRLIVIGDIHGNFQLLVDRLRAGRVLQEEKDDDEDDTNIYLFPRWKRGENAIVVQVGDLLDRGADELACLALLARLSHEAQQWGGAMIVLLGNHEIMNIGGDFRCVASNEPWKKAFDGFYGQHFGDDGDNNHWKKLYVTTSPSHGLPSFPTRWAACQPGTGILAQHFFSHCKVIVQVGTTVIVHAHWNDRCFNAYGNNITTINQRASEWLQQSPCPWSASGDERFLAIDASMDQTFPVPEPFWGRQRATTGTSCSPPTEKDEDAEEMSRILARFQTGARRLVVGHERCDRIHATNNAYIWKVDAPNRPDVLQINHLDHVQVLTWSQQLRPKRRRSPTQPRWVVVADLLLLLDRFGLWLWRAIRLVVQAAQRALRERFVSWRVGVSTAKKRA
jgi:hypothetical protein